MFRKKTHPGYRSDLCAKLLFNPGRQKCDLLAKTTGLSNEIIKKPFISPVQGEPIVIGDQVDRNSKVTEPVIGNVKIFAQKAFSLTVG